MNLKLESECNESRVTHLSGRVPYPSKSWRQRLGRNAHPRNYLEDWRERLRGKTFSLAIIHRRAARRIGCTRLSAKSSVKREVIVNPRGFTQSAGRVVVDEIRRREEG